MAVRLKDMEEALTSADDDLLHIQTDGTFLDRKIKKSVLMESVLTDFDNLEGEFDTFKTEVQESQSNIVIEHIGGGVLTAARINEIQDSSTYTLPPAVGSVAGTIIDIMITDKYSAQTPQVDADTTLPDMIEDVNTEYTGILLSNGATLVRLVSDGISKWRF